jgi:hypothetical protein
VTWTEDVIVAEPKRLAAEGVGISSLAARRGASARLDRSCDRRCGHPCGRAHSFAEDPRTMNCPRCATINLDGSVVCSSCGAQLPAAMPPAGAGYPPPGAGYAPPPQGYYPPPYGVPMQMAPSTSGMAIAGFVLSVLSCALLGLIFSIIGYTQVKNSNGMKTGGGLALAGIIVSICWFAISILLIASGNIDLR